MLRYMERRGFGVSSVERGQAYLSGHKLSKA